MNDSEQTTLFPKTKKELAIEREKDLLNKALPILQDAVKAKNANPDDISFKCLDSYSSMTFRSSLIFRLNLRGKKPYISIPNRLREIIPDTVETTTTKSESQFTRIPFDSLNESDLIRVIKNATLLAIESGSKEFDCCSRYRECSDAKVCIHPDPVFSTRCGYRKILKSGRIFYGKNRNVD